MKKLFLLLVSHMLLLSLTNAQNPVKISELPTYPADSVNGWIPVSVNNVTYKINKASLTVVPAEIRDTAWLIQQFGIRIFNPDSTYKPNGLPVAIGLDTAKLKQYFDQYYSNITNPIDSAAISFFVYAIDAAPNFSYDEGTQVLIAHTGTTGAFVGHEDEVAKLVGGIYTFPYDQPESGDQLLLSNDSDPDRTIIQGYRFNGSVWIPGAIPHLQGGAALGVIQTIGTNDQRAFIIKTNDRNRLRLAPNGDLYLIKFKGASIKRHNFLYIEDTATGKVGLDTFSIDNHFDSLRNNAGVLEGRKNGVFIPQFTLPTGGTYTASNGLTMSGNDVRLGGSLSTNTTINTTNKTLTINGTSGISATISNTAGTSLYASSSTGLPARFVTTGGASLERDVVEVVNSAGGGDSGLTSILLFRTKSSGYGTDIPTTRLKSILTSSASLSSASDFIITGFNSGAENNLLTLSGNGRAKLNAYTSGNFYQNDTASYKPAVIGSDGTLYRSNWFGSTASSIDSTFGLTDNLATSTRLFNQDGYDFTFRGGAVNIDATIGSGYYFIQPGTYEHTQAISFNQPGGQIRFEMWNGDQGGGIGRALQAETYIYSDSENVYPPKISLRPNGTNRLQVFNDGLIKFNAYISGSFYQNDTSSYKPLVSDADGNVYRSSWFSGGGGGITDGDKGDITVSGSGSTWTIDNGSVSASKLVGSDITTVGTITTGTWHGDALTDTYISSASTWNAKQAGDATLTALAAYNTNGFVAQTSADNFTGRTMTGSGDIDIANGDGVSGNPTFTISSTLDFKAKTLRVTDNIFYIHDNSDNTKVLKLDAANISTGTTRTFLVPDINSTLAVIGNTSQTFSGNTTFSNGTVSVGTSTGTATYGIGDGATTNGTTKTINIGTAGVSGSTTNINIGSSVSGSTGTLTVNSSSTFNKAATFAKPIITSGSTPTYTLGSAAGTGATASITGNDAAGLITVNLGSTSGSGDFITITFSATLANTPKAIMLTPANDIAAAEFTGMYVDASSTSTASFKIKASTTLSGSFTQKWYYVVID